MREADWQTEDGAIRLYCGDCRDYLDDLRGEVDCVVTDPPYGIGYCHGARKGGVKRGTDGMRIAGDDVQFDPTPWLSWPCAMWGAEHYKTRLPHGGRWLTWDKRSDGVTRDQGDAEHAWCSNTGVTRVIRMAWDGFVMGEESGRKRVHSNQKPVRVMEWTIGFVDGLTVCDPYMGSGTTGVACVRAGRKFIGIELDGKHFATAVDRITKELERLALFEPKPKIIQRNLLGDST